MSIAFRIRSQRTQAIAAAKTARAVGEPRHSAEGGPPRAGGTRHQQGFDCLTSAIDSRRAGNHLASVKDSFANRD